MRKRIIREKGVFTFLKEGTYYTLKKTPLIRRYIARVAGYSLLKEIESLSNLSSIIV